MHYNNLWFKKGEDSGRRLADWLLTVGHQSGRYKDDNFVLKLWNLWCGWWQLKMIYKDDNFVLKVWNLWRVWYHLKMKIQRWSFCFKRMKLVTCLMTLLMRLLMRPVQHPILPAPSSQTIAGTNSTVLKPHAMYVTNWNRDIDQLTSLS